LRILITNIRLADRSGTEIVVRDLALRLSERKHQVFVYTPFIGRLAGDLTRNGIRVTDNLSVLPEVPDVIHGHHMPCTAEAICAFPQTPAIWVCHSSDAWFDAPPQFSQVLRHFAVDETCRARLVNSSAVAFQNVEILPNAVDLRTFVERKSQLPFEPIKAVSLVKHATPISLISEACRQCGLNFSASGHGVGEPIDDIERRFAEADIVFATARTALEAMAAGAAVILVDGRGFGGMVTAKNFELGRRLNFGLGMLKSEATLENLVSAIRLYDPVDAAAVSARVRTEADLDTAVSRLECIYASVIEQAKGKQFHPNLFREEQIRFHRSWLARLDQTAPWLADRTALVAIQKELEEKLLLKERQAIEKQENMISLQGKIVGLEQSGADLEQQKMSLAQANAVLEGKIAGLEQSTADLEQQKMSFEHANAVLIDQIANNAILSAAGLDHQKTSFGQANAALKDQIASLEKSNAILTDTITSLNRSRALKLARFIRGKLSWRRNRPH
jgi:hypothetical protein